MKAKAEYDEWLLDRLLVELLTRWDKDRMARLEKERLAQSGKP